MSSINLIRFFDTFRENIGWLLTPKLFFKDSSECDNWDSYLKMKYRKTSINVRGNYNFFTFFTAGIIRGRISLEVFYTFLSNIRGADTIRRRILLEVLRYSFILNASDQWLFNLFYLNVYCIYRFRLDQNPPSPFSSFPEHAHSLSLFSHNSVGRNDLPKW